MHCNYFYSQYIPFFDPTDYQLFMQNLMKQPGQEIWPSMNQMVWNTLSQCYVHRWHFSTIFWHDVYVAKRLFNCETGSFPSNMAMKWQLCNIYWPQIIEEDCGLRMFPNVQDNSNNFNNFHPHPRLWAWKQERLLTSEIIINI